VIGFVATALSWLGNFKGPCLILAIVSALAGAGAATWATRAIMRGDVAEARQQLADFRAELATQSARIEQEAAARQKAAADALRERDQSITAAVDGIPGEVARLIAPQFAKLRASVADTRFDCLRQPLPEPYLEGLRRPGGSALEPQL
jgi:hypothetical protein